MSEQKVRFEKWGYKGLETSLNGLTNWIQDKIDFKGSAEHRRNESLRIVVAYGVENIPNFINKGHLSNKAEYVAKKIKYNDKFDHFAKWVTDKYIKTNSICLYKKK